MVDRSMSGVYPILSMPFDKDGRVDEEELRHEVEWAIGFGVQGLGIAMASEIYKLTEKERDMVLNVVVDQAAGRAKIVMNTGAEGTDLSVIYSRRAEELGADALMIRPPTYIPSGTEEDLLYFRTIAESVSIPIFLQDQSEAPVAPATAVRLARDHENLCYIKIETPPTVPRVAEAALLRGDSGLILFGGAGGNYVFEEVHRGTVGTMPGCTMPDVFMRVWKMWHEGDRDAAQREIHRHAAFMRTINQGLGLSPWIYKEVLVRRGVFKAAYARRPAKPPDQMQLLEINTLMDELNLTGS